jgi:Mn2+/Fe2+ NRAMP family transporter
VLVFGGEAKVFTVAFGLLTLVLQVFVPYTRYVRVLKWLTLVLFSYVAVLFTIHIPCGEVLRAVVMPRLQMKAEYLTTVVAIFGTTISPYLFFWQASQEVDEMRSDPKAKPLLAAPEQAPASFRRMKADTVFGMGVSNLIAFFIVLTAALALHAKGVTDIQTSAQAANDETVLFSFSDRPVQEVIGIHRESFLDNDDIRGEPEQKKFEIEPSPLKRSMDGAEPLCT